jgi:hypothetical protein
MAQIYDWAWVQVHVAQTIEVWNTCAGRIPQRGQRYSSSAVQKQEDAYDEALEAVEQELDRVPQNKADRLATQDRIVASFARFSATALALDAETTGMLTNDFLPVGTKLARWARRFDANLSMADITQACRNAWTACGLQPLLGVPVGISPSILGYSLLYPYSDNYLDQEEVAAEGKLQFSKRFRRMLQGEKLSLSNDRECALWSLIHLVEGQYPRESYPQVFDCLLAIHRAQEESLRQVTSAKHFDEAELLRVSCGKGGSSVLADACLARGWLSEEESRFAFEWGVLLQLGDDLQDLREDMRRGSVTLFSRTAALGRPLDGLALQLLKFSEQVGARMDRLPEGSPMLKDLLKMSWRSLIIRAVADSHEFFSTQFLAEAERNSPFRFEFLRARQERLVSRQGLYAMLFEAFLEPREGDDDGLPPPHREYGCVAACVNSNAVHETY